MIVRQNHEIARALLKERASSKNLPSTSSFRQDDTEFLDGDDHDDEHNDDPLLEENVATANTQSPMDMEQDCDVLMGGSTPDETSVLVTEPPVSAGSLKKSSVQSTLSAFIVPKVNPQASI